MVLAQKKVTAILFVLTLASSQAEEPTAAADSLDATKRDLRSLPTANQSLLGPQQGDLKIDVPNIPSINSSALSKPSTSLLPPSSAGTKGEYQAGGVNSPSEGWLIDAFNVANTQVRAQRAADDQHAKDLQQLRGKAGGSAAANPFSPYMSQWLSPHDPVLLQITGPNQTAGTLSANGSFDSLNPKTRSQSNAAGNPAAGASTNGSQFLNPSTGSQNPAVGGSMANPYLPAETTASPSSGAKTGSGLFPTNMTQSSSANGASPLPASGRRPAKLAEPAYTPPTAPLIDERKYFPQLHRF